MTIQATASRTIHAPQEDVWAAISDMTTVDKWNPSVDSVDLLSSNKSGVGATRVCHFTDGTSVKEMVTEVDGHKKLHLVLSEYDFPMKTFEADILVEPRGDQTSEVTFLIDYDVKYGPIGYVMGITIMKMQMRKVFKRVLAGLDAHLETGEVIGEDFKPSKPKQ